MADTYDVTNVTGRLIPRTGGGYDTSTLVTFTTKPSGLAGQVIVTGDTPDPADIATAVSAEAARLEQVKNL